MPHPLVWKHKAEAPMFPNWKSMDSRIKCYSQKLQKNHGESMLLPLQEDFLVFLCDNLNVSYREKRGKLWPVSRHVKSAETFVVFPNLGWGTVPVNRFVSGLIQFCFTRNLLPWFCLFYRFKLKCVFQTCVTDLFYLSKTEFWWDHFPYDYV